MSRKIFCQKLKKEAEGLTTQPYPGELGQQIFEHISKEAWQMWLKRQVMFINEYRLNLAEPKARELLEKEMRAYLFEGSDKTPDGFVS
jgi:Fe-S cluster biosynthesis and repair protein YggX